MKFNNLRILVCLLVANIFAFSQDQENNKFSFGINYSPLDISQTITFRDNYYYSTKEILLNNANASLEARLALLVTKNIHVIGSVDYYKTYLKYKYRKVKINTSDHYADSFGGYENEDGLSIVNVGIGLKYLFKKPIPKKVSPYIFAGVSKKIATVIAKSKDLYPDDVPSEYKNSDNLEEYIEQLNSPVILHLAYGGEYFFSDDISFESQFRFDMSIIHASYKSEESGTSYSDNTFDETINRDYDATQINQRISLGINLYF